MDLLYKGAHLLAHHMMLLLNLNSKSEKELRTGTCWLDFKVVSALSDRHLTLWLLSGNSISWLSHLVALRWGFDMPKHMSWACAATCTRLNPQSLDMLRPTDFEWRYCLLESHPKTSIAGAENELMMHLCNCWRCSLECWLALRCTMREWQPRN
jgi:hypothetical protein